MTLSLSTFQDLLDSHGGDFDRWPARERRAAQALLATSTEARALLVTAQGLDAALAGPSVRAPEALRARIRAIPARHPRAVRPPAAGRRPALTLWLGGAAMAASVALGFYVGAAGLLVPSESEVAAAPELPYPELPYEVAFELEELR